MDLPFLSPTVSSLKRRPPHPRTPPSWTGLPSPVKVHRDFLPTVNRWHSPLPPSHKVRRLCRSRFRTPYCLGRYKTLYLYLVSLVSFLPPYPHPSVSPCFCLFSVLLRDGTPGVILRTRGGTPHSSPRRHLRPHLRSTGRRLRSRSSAPASPGSHPSPGSFPRVGLQTCPTSFGPVLPAPHTPPLSGPVPRVPDGNSVSLDFRSPPV